MARISARPFAIPGISGLVGPDAADGWVCYMGASVAEAAGTPGAARIRIRAGSLTGQIIDEVRLAASGSWVTWYAPHGIAVPGQIYVEVVAGITEGSVFVQ